MRIFFLFTIVSAVFLYSSELDIPELSLAVGGRDEDTAARLIKVELIPNKLSIIRDHYGVVHEAHAVVPKITAAYFKHFKQEGKPNEVIVYYDHHGQSIRSLLVSAHMTEHYHHFLEQLERNDESVLPIIVERKKGNGYIVSYTKYKDIVKVRKHTKKKRQIPTMNGAEFERLEREALLVVHSSVYDHRTISSLAEIKKAAASKIS